MPLVNFYDLWQYQKAYDFQTFLGIVERDHWYEMGYQDW